MEEAEGASILRLAGDVSLLPGSGVLQQEGAGSGSGPLLQGVDIDWASAPEAGAWAAGAWGPGLWRPPSYEERRHLTPAEIDATMWTHWSVSNSGRQIDRRSYYEMRRLQREFAEQFGLEEEKKAVDELYIPFTIWFEEVKHMFNDDDNRQLCQKYDMIRELILPGLWMDIYKPLLGSRSLEFDQKLHQALREASALSDRIHDNGNDAVPLPIDWWFEMNKSREVEIDARRKNVKNNCGKLD